VETLRAVRLTAVAAGQLQATGRTGRVHSAFARTANVELDGSAEPEWLSLHGPGPIPSPFGIACEAAPVLADHAGAAVRVEPDALVVEGRMRIRLAGARVEETMLPATAPMPSIDRCVARGLHGTADGLLPAVAALVVGVSPTAMPLAELAGPTLARLASATHARDAAGSLAAAERLLGLGPGLTPSGDDCLVGWLAAAWVGDDLGRALGKAVGPELLTAAGVRTGPLSRAFLAAAARGHVAVPVRDFVVAPDDRGLAGLLALGETSGADVLAGYLLGRHALPAAALAGR
jgi:hypothetical protein